MSLWRDLRLKKRARQAAHQAFDPIWVEGHMTRGQAYCWLAKKLKIHRADCHMSLFDVETCRRVVAICKLLGPKLETQSPGDCLH